MDYERLGREMLAAGLGCAIADGSLNGLEVTKVKMQLDSGTPSYYPKTMTGTIRQCVAEDGAWRGLMAPGLTATFLRAMTYVAFRVGTYPTVRDAVSGGGGPTLQSRVLSGAITGGVGSVIFCPIDVVRVRMQADAPGCHARLPDRVLLRTGLRAGMPVRYPTTLGAFGRIVSSEGVAGLYRGSGATVARATLLSGSQLGSYDALKDFFKTWLGASENVPLHLSCSLLSGLIAQTVIQPVDTARSHIMNNTPAVSTLTMVKRHGPLWLYRGYTAACWRQGPIMLMQMPLVEQIRLLLGVGAL